MTLGWMLGMLGIDMLVGLTVSPILVAVGVCSLLNIAWTLSLPVMGRWSP